MPRPKLNVVVFWVVQCAAPLAFFVPLRWPLVALALASHSLRILGITLAFHRHLAHGAVEMGRVTRFFWAFLGTAAMEKAPLWWAGNHVYHHRSADREGDPHSPRLVGFYQAHIGWFLDEVRYDTLPADNPVLRRFSAYAEIRWLERFYAVPPAALALLLFALGGWPWLVWGFVVPTVSVAHSTFAINTINHLFGTRRFATPDDPLTALLTFGEGWHNNHHRYQRAARNGFFWWELDVTYWLIRAMEALGLAWRVQPVPARIYAEARPGRLRGAPPALEAAP